MSLVYGVLILVALDPKSTILNQAAPQEPTSPTTDWSARHLANLSTASATISRILAGSSDVGSCYDYTQWITTEIDFGFP